MSLSRSFAFSASLACLILACATPVSAQDAIQCPPTKPHSARHVTHRATTHRKVIAQGDTITRIAQEHLKNLGYYMGKIDGKMGPATRNAIKRFQQQHGLKADGVLGTKTRRALDDADHPPQLFGKGSQLMSRHGFGAAIAGSATAPGDHSVDQDYETPLPSGSKSLSSRFVPIDVSETGAGADKHYDVTLNGQPILTVDGQPSVIGISVVYDLGNEEAVIFTTYAPDSTCVYKTHVLALNSGGNRMLDIDNCTRYYKAHVDQGSLYVTFPEVDDNRDVGATWRLDGMDLERL